ncbi:hypothetical protein EDB85DRAFT_1853897 [Lactarius pseudohatsudake]|nr:hypothetical protein EDB85DRAFT_1853897 [Lactarius pseudohatsudake]
MYPHSVASSCGLPKPKLIRNGADVNAQDENDPTPLHLASSNHEVDSMQLLILSPRDVNARDKINATVTPLHLASLTVTAESAMIYPALGCYK